MISDKGNAVKGLTELPRRPFRFPAEIGPLLGLVGVFALFMTLLAWRGNVEHFLSLYNLQLLMHQNAIRAVVVIGTLFVIISGGIDLSVGSVAALSAVVSFTRSRAVRRSGVDTVESRTRASGNVRYIRSP